MIEARLWGQSSRRVAVGLLVVLSATIGSMLNAQRAQSQAFGPSAGVSNSGGANSATGGNVSTGNASTNGIANTATDTNTGLLDGLLGLDVTLGGNTNTSNGTSGITTGGAASSGNQSSSAVNQAVNPGGTAATAAPIFNPFFNPFFTGPSASAVSTGSAGATTGGNTGVGNASQNAINNTATGTGGLINATVGLGGNTNTSTGTSNIQTGPAVATGNVSQSSVNQALGGAGHGGLFDSCTGLPTFLGLVGGPSASALNEGAANADTGGNQSVGNSSVNTITNNQTVSGGLLGLGVNLGGNSNVSDGTSAITTGPASAVGNQSTSNVNQVCGQQHVAKVHHPVPIAVVPVIHPVHVQPLVAVPVGTTLAKTGLDALDMALIAFGILYAGFLFLTWSKVETVGASSRKRS